MASDYVRFSANKVLRRKQLENLPFGAIFSPWKDVIPLPHVFPEKDDMTCGNCSAKVCVFCILTDDGWKCLFCKTQNPWRNTGGGQGHISSCMVNPVYDLVKSTVQAHIGVRIGSSMVDRPICIIIDASLGEQDLSDLKRSLVGFVKSLPEEKPVIIVASYGVEVFLHHPLTGNAVPQDQWLQEVDITQSSANRAGNLAGLEMILKSINPYRQPFTEAERGRCLGAAVETTINVLLQCTIDDFCSTILVCSGGSNTRGPGSVSLSTTAPSEAAVTWMKRLGQKAQKNRFIVDILCAGFTPANVCLLRPLAEATGGTVVLHRDFGAHFCRNLVAASLRAEASYDSTITVHCSGARVADIIGPTIKNIEISDHSSRTGTVSVDKTHGFSVFWEVNENLFERELYFQFVAVQVDFFGSTHTRVITVKLPTVGNVYEYLESIKPEVVAVLLAKRALLTTAAYKDVNLMRAAIGETIKTIAQEFGHKVFRYKLVRFPKEISSLPEILFHLQRGPLAGRIIGHEDEWEYLRSVFLNASFELSIRMVEPRCLLYRDGGLHEEVPAYDLALQSDTAVMLDHGTHIFIWIGSEIAAGEGSMELVSLSLKTHAEEVSKHHRFPKPEILIINEGASEDRYIVTRLIPAIRDLPHEQEARFPTFTEEQRSKLESKTVYWDENPSFLEWMRRLKLVAPSLYYIRRS